MQATGPQRGAVTLGGGIRDRAVHDLEAEVKLLDWHRLANESSLRAALLRTKRMRRRQREEVDGTLGLGDGGEEQRPSSCPNSTAPPSRGVRVRSDGRPQTALHPPPSRRLSLRMLEEEERCKSLGRKGDDEDERGSCGKMGLSSNGLTSSEPVTSRQLESVRRAIARVEMRRIAQERRKSCGMFQRTNDVRREGRPELEKKDVENGGECEEEGSEKENGQSLLSCHVATESCDNDEEEDGDEHLSTVLAGLDKLIALERRIRALEGREGETYSVEASQTRRVRTAPVRSSDSPNLSVRAASAGSFSRESGLGSRQKMADYKGDDVRILARRRAILVAARQRSREGRVPDERSVVTPNSSLRKVPNASCQLHPRRRTVRFDDSRCQTAPCGTVSQSLTGCHAPKPSTADGPRE